MENNNYKLLITGGHLTPAKAVIEELKLRGYKNFVWVGRRRTMRGDRSDSAEYNLIHKDMGIPFENLNSGKIIKFDDLKSFVDFIINSIKIPIGFLQSILIILKHRPKIIMSFGGYVALPIVIIAWVLRIPSITHEQTVVTGKANKIISKFAKKVCISWKDSLKYFDKSKTVLTGNPIRSEVLKVTTSNFLVNDKIKTIYITGGNQGSHVINEAVLEIVDNLLKKYNVIHQTGMSSLTRDFENCDKLAKSLIGKTKGIYIVRGNIYGVEIGEVFNKADLVISRSGANTLTEFLALGKPAILIPIPWSINNEQLKNAKMLEKVGLGRILKQKDLNGRSLEQAIKNAIKSIMKNKDFNNKSLKKAIKTSQSLVNLNAAKMIVDEVLNLIK